MFFEGATELNTNGITRFSSVSQVEMDTTMETSVDNLGVIGSFANRFARIHGTSGVFNHLTPQSSGTFISTHGGLIPAVNSRFNLGTAQNKWGQVRATSGVFNMLVPPTSGTVGGLPGQWIETYGSLVPNINRTYALGTNGRRWQILHAESGSIQTISSSSVTIGTDLNFAKDGFNINSIGAVIWDGDNGEVSITNMNLWDFGATAVTGDDSTWTDLTATDAVFTNRPTAGGSGVAMQKENYFEVYGGRAINFGNPIKLMNLNTTADGAPLAPHDYFFIVQEDVQLRNYSIEATHLSANPAPWAIRLRINDQTNDHASGLFGWHPTANTAARSFGSLSGTQTIPAGTRCRFIVDANGGAGHNTAYVKLFLGLTAVSGLKRGPQV